MVVRSWGNLPRNMQNEFVREYYDILYKKRFELFVKQLFDRVCAILMFILLSPAFLIISIAIKVDSKGPILYRQVRITQYGKQFRIYKFRTMIHNPDKSGTQVTLHNDSRVTTVGKFLRKFRLDEFPQLFNIIMGDMSFVGPRPEVVKYVELYTDEMLATLLLPAGITSEASIHFKDENSLLEEGDNIDEIYVNYILPEKMKYNLNSLREFSCFRDVQTMLRTVSAFIKRNEGG